MLVPSCLAGVFPWESSVRIDRCHLHLAAVKARGILMAVLALVAFRPLFLLHLRLPAMAGVVVPAGLMVGALVIFACVQGRRERAGWDFGVLVVLGSAGVQPVLWRHWCLVA